MSTDFMQVLREMEAREAELLAELKDIQTAKPAIKRMADAMPVSLQPSTIVDGDYVGLGTKDAILAFLVQQSQPMSVSSIASALLDGGIKTKATDFLSVVKSTLATLKVDGKVERKEDGWVITRDSSSGPTQLSVQ